MGNALKKYDMKKFIIILMLGLFYLSGFSQTTMSGLYYPYQRNPKKALTCYQQVYTGISIKTGGGTLTSSSYADFFTAFSISGASASVVTNDTYVTVCDVTGAGFLYNVVGCANTSAGDAGIKITIDGTVYTYETTGNLISTNYRMCVGNPLFVGVNLIDNQGIGATADGGITSYSGGVFKITGGSLLIPTGFALRTYNIQGVRFDVSLKVECKIEVILGSGITDQCGAQYILDL